MDPVYCGVLGLPHPRITQESRRAARTGADAQTTSSQGRAAGADARPDRAQHGAASAPALLWRVPRPGLGRLRQRLLPRAGQERSEALVLEQAAPGRLARLEPELAEHGACICCPRVRACLPFPGE